MPNKPQTLGLFLIVIAVLALTGCAPRTGQGTVAAQEGADQFAVDLPAMVVEVGADGALAMGGVPLAQLGSAFGAAGLESATLPADTVAQLVAANIQHIQINNTPEGLSILVNNQAIPSVAWNAESLQSLTALGPLLGDALPAPVSAILPSLSRLGAGVIVHLPVGEGQTPIEIGAAAAADTSAAQTAQDDFIASVGAPGKISIPVLYDAEGGWTVNGLTDAEWTAITGQTFWQSLRLSPETIGGLTAAGVTQITVSTDAAGIHVALNGAALPHLDWSDGKLNGLVQLAADAGALDALADSGMNPDDLVAALTQLLPMVTATDLDIHVTLPE